MTPATAAVKNGWHVHAPRREPAAKTGGYRLTAGRHKGLRLDEVPADYLVWLADFSPSPALRLLAKKALEIDVVLDDGDPCQVAPPSGAFASDALPLLTFEFEKRLRAELGHFDPDSAEAHVIARAVTVLRSICTSYTGRTFGPEGGAK